MISASFHIYFNCGEFDLNIMDIRHKHIYLYNEQQAAGISHFIRQTNEMIFIIMELL